MGTRIPEETIENIRKSTDIVEVISEYVSLKKQGRNYMGLCPFHGEKTPSFSVSPEKQIYHCFGCGVGGNVFSFLIEVEGLDFLQSVKKLADKTKIELPQLEAGSNRNHNGKELNLIKDGHELLAKLYHHCLLNTEHGKKALQYLEDRGFTQEVIAKFQIGYAPDSW
jgi:DNA primase